MFLYYSAKLRDVRALTALGYISKYGIGVEKRCKSAKSYYLSAAKYIARSMTPREALYAKKPTRLTATASRNNEIQSREKSLEYYEYSSNSVDSASLTLLGQLYYIGTKDFEPDDEKALHFLKLAAAEGSAAAASLVGQIYYRGEAGVAVNYETAREYFMQGAKKNVAVAFNGLGNMSLHGHGVEKDEKEAEKYFADAAAIGHPESQHQLAMLLLDRPGSQNKSKAFEHLIESAQNGYVLSNIPLVKRFFIADTTCDASVVLLRQLIEKGPITALYRQAFDDFSQGRLLQALSRYLIVATQGSEVAHYNIAFIVEKLATFGLQTRALLHYTRSAHLGYTPAWVRAGDIFFYGRGLSKPDQVSAMAYYIKAAMNTPADDEAAFNVAICFEHGLGTSKDLYYALDFYRLAFRAEPKSWLVAYPAIAKVRVKLWIHQMQRQIFEKAILVSKPSKRDEQFLMICLTICLIVFSMYYRNHLLQTRNHNANHEARAQRDRFRNRLIESSRHRLEQAQVDSSIQLAKSSPSPSEPPTPPTEHSGRDSARHISEDEEAFPFSRSDHAASQ